MATSMTTTVGGIANEGTLLGTLAAEACQHGDVAQLLQFPLL